MGEKGGGEFLNINNSGLQKSEQVQHSVEKKLRLDGIKTPNSPKDRNEVFLNRLENIFENPNEQTKERNIELFKSRFLYPSVLIDKNNVPDSYFKLQQEIAIKRGQGGDLPETIDDETKRKTGEMLYNDQKKSLDTWTDYLTSDDAIYPSWFKYYTMKNVVKMGAYDKEKKEFGKRTKTTTTIFPDLNREALSFTYDALEKYYLKHEKFNQEELTRVLDTTSFSKIYAYAIDKVTPASKENKEKIEGEWTKFNQGTDSTALYESLQGHGTGWCTAGEETARTQLENGDFYVYYSKDQDNKNTIPRIAIRMENGQVAEVRGIEKEQNLEGNMTDIAQEKYHQLPGGDKFDKKDHDMKLLTQLITRQEANQELSKEDLRFLYEIDSKIEGFGYDDDPRIDEIKLKRDVWSDIAFAMECLPEEVSTNYEGPPESGGKYHYGELDFSDVTSTEGLVFPENVLGNLDLSDLISADGLKLPETVRGILKLRDLRSIDGLKLPETVGGLNLSSLISADGLKLPETVGGILNLGSLRSIDGLELPKTVEGNLSLDSLISAEGLKLPETFKGSLYLGSLTSADGLKLPETLRGSLDLNSLRSTDDLELPKTVEGYLYLNGLISADGLKLPETIKASLFLNSLTSTDNLELPETFRGSLYLDKVSSEEKKILRIRYPKVNIL